MPVIKCKGKDGLADSCKRDIVFQSGVHSVFGVSPAGGNTPASEAAKSDVIHLTLQCLDGHINNYEIKREQKD